MATPEKIVRKERPVRIELVSGTYQYVRTGHTEDGSYIVFRMDCIEHYSNGSTQRVRKEFTGPLTPSRSERHSFSEGGNLPTI